MNIKANYYQQFDADYSLDVPGEGYGGWRRTTIELAPEHTALVVMHAWDTGAPEQYPGWYRAVEYFPRARAILEEVFPPLLTAMRRSRLKIYHVTGCGMYGRKYPGYSRALALAGPDPSDDERVDPDPASERLTEFRSAHVFVGSHNAQDVGRGFKTLDFPAQARPLGDEGVAENARQLFALCKADGVNHLVYAGFAINWCLLMSAGGMLDMSRRGCMCSTIRQAVAAVENKQTARRELCKENALWRVALAFGFVFDLDDFMAALEGERE